MTVGGFERSDEPIGELNDRQKKFLLASLTNSTVEKASEEAGIAVSTGYNYLKNKDFKEAQRTMQRKIMSVVTGRLQYEATKSIDTLASIRDDTKAPPYSRVEASKTLLEYAFKGYELDDVIERVEKLEELLEE